MSVSFNKNFHTCNTCGKRPLLVNLTGKREKFSTPLNLPHFIYCPRCNLKSRVFNSGYDAVKAWKGDFNNAR